MSKVLRDLYQKYERQVRQERYVLRAEPKHKAPTYTEGRVTMAEQIVVDLREALSVVEPISRRLLGLRHVQLHRWMYGTILLLSLCSLSNIVQVAIAMSGR